MVDISKRGFRQKEPAEFALGQPSLLARAIDLVKDKLFFDEFASGVYMLPDELESILKTQMVEDSAIQAMKRQRTPKKTKIVFFNPQ